MRGLISFLLIGSILLTYVLSETTDEELEAEEAFNQMLDDLDTVESEMDEEEAREDEENTCIGKHHECTHDKENCCRGKLFQYKCKCYDVTDEEGNSNERCACENPFTYKMAEWIYDLGKKMG